MILAFILSPEVIDNVLNEGVNCDLIKCEAKIPLYVYMLVDTTLTV